jgi:hypothetical protein
MKTRFGMFGHMRGLVEEAGLQRDQGEQQEWSQRKGCIL